MDSCIPPVESLEAALRQVRGVVAVRVVATESEVTEIHVLAAVARPAKQVVRDVEAVCAARFHLDIDHRCISVAQVDVPTAAAVVRRPRLHGVRVEAAGDAVTVAVQLAVGSDAVSGEASGFAASSWRPHLAAQATVRAVEQLLQGAYRLELADLAEFRLLEHRGYAVAVSLLSRRGEERLIGCALVTNDIPEACARAVLDSVNRRLDGLKLAPGGREGHLPLR